MDLRTRREWGLPPNPWADPLDTPDMVRVREAVRDAAAARAMVWILGPRGCGKTVAVRAALEALGAPVVEPLRVDRERLRMGDICAAAVRDLSDERPRQSGEARTAQVRRLVGGSPQRTLLVIDEAHALHPATVRGLKRLRELPFRGRSPLLGVVLVAQRDASKRIPEVGLRSDRLRLAGLDPSTAAAAIDRAVNRDRERIAPDAVRVIAESPAARNWLELQDAVDRCLAPGLGVGKVDAATARRALGAAAPARAEAPAKGDLAEQLKRSAA